MANKSARQELEIAVFTIISITEFKAASLLSPLNFAQLSLKVCFEKVERPFR